MPLIDIDALKKQMCKICNENYSDDPCEPNDCVFLNAIDSAPTIDAVPVVRCKECKHFVQCKEVEGVSWTGFCNYGEFHTDEEDFCSRGERRSE